MSKLAMTAPERGTNEHDTFVDEVVDHHDVLSRVAWRLTRQAQDAEDLVQETIARALSRRGQYQPGTNLRAWLLAIERSLFVSAYRHARRGPTTASIDDIEEGVLYSRSGLVPSPSAETTLLQDWVDHDLVAAVQALPEHYRVAVLLSDVQGLSYAEILQRMGWPLGTLTSRLHRGRALLRRALTDRSGEWEPGAPGARTAHAAQPLRAAA
jgi:RNA polymerase sigma-70 factor (ECF subfamily)